MKIIFSKFYFIFLLLYRYLISIPERVFRLITYPFDKSIRNSKFHLCILEMFLLLIDVLGFPEWISIIQELLNWKLRKLTPFESTEIESIFGGSLNSDFIRVNPHGIFFCKKWRIAFVSFYVVNFYKHISMETMIHEIVHIWQFENFGSLYILRSLIAQHGGGGYNYGGIGELIKGMSDRKNIMDYNFEQMAEVVKDAYIYSKMSNRNVQYEPVFEHFLRSIK